MIKADKGIVEMEGLGCTLIAEVGTICVSICREDEELKIPLLASIILSLYGGDDIRPYYKQADKLAKFIKYKMEEYRKENK